MPKKITEAQILEVVLDVVLERGYAGATTRHIAERAEISEVTLFRRYKNKAGLVIAAVGYLYEGADSRTFAKYTGDIEADLLRILRRYQKRGRSRFRRFLPLLLTELPRHPELQGVLEAPFANVSGVGAMFLRYQEEGILRREHPIHAAAGLLGPLIILLMLRDATPEIDIPEIDLKQHVNNFLRGRRTSPPASDKA